MDDLADVRHADAGGSDQFVQPGERTNRRVGRRGERLVQAQRMSEPVVENEIGEGAADVEADAITGEGHGNWGAQA